MLGGGCGEGGGGGGREAQCDAKERGGGGGRMTYSSGLSFTAIGQCDNSVNPMMGSARGMPDTTCQMKQPSLSRRGSAILYPLNRSALSARFISRGSCRVWKFFCFFVLRGRGGGLYLFFVCHG